MANDHHRKEPPDTNKVSPKAVLNGFDWTFLQSSSAAADLRLNFCASISQPSQSPKTVSQF
ncbi:MAG TPA: hypothetical protein PK191_04340 [Niabella sp.]|nr:hypothetical protein [Niabella sp.]HOZ97835.1 hypothetical protein [Niabella sp.]HQW15674.1 hypothetical protein [Niabella sp.]HQX20809.1 hypothetical protein [Niabella sp.]HQX41394.1 hypothetical protein [Niabella sp.]